MVSIDGNANSVMLPNLAAVVVLQTNDGQTCPSVCRLAKNILASMTGLISRRSRWSNRVSLLMAGLLVLSLPACSPLLSRRDNVVCNCEITTPAVCLQASEPPAQEAAQTVAPTAGPVPDNRVLPATVIVEPGVGAKNSSSQAPIKPAAVRVDDTELPPLLPMPGRFNEVPPNLLPRELVAEPEPAPPPRTVSLPSNPWNTPVLAALHAYLTGQTHQAIQLLCHYDDHDQQFLLRLFPILEQLERQGLHSAALTPQDREVLLQALQGLSADLRQQAPLRVRQLTFCRRVLSFGKFEPVSANRFVPGQAVGIYCELENLEDQALGNDRFCLTLTGQITIHNAQGKPCWHQPIQFEPDISRSPRLDHFLFVRFRIPAELGEGAYRLILSLRDEQTQRNCQGELPFQIVSSPTSNP